MTARRLDDDHVGAEVAEHLARERGVLRRQLDDLQAVEGTGEGVGAWVPSHDAVLRQLLDLGVVEAEELGEHLVVVLAEARAAARRSTSRSRRSGAGMPSTRTSPISRWWAVGHRPHSLVPGSWSMRSSGRCTAVAGTPAARSDSATANRSRVRVHSAMRASSASCTASALGQRVVARDRSPTARRSPRPCASSRRRHGTRWRPSCRRRRTGRCRAARAAARGCGSSRVRRRAAADDR